MLVSAVLMFATSSSLMAQFKFGVKASATLNNMFYADDTMKDIKRVPVFGFNVGVMGEYFLNDNMSIGAELVFAQQGFKREYEYDMSEYRYQHGVLWDEEIFQTNHINLPILFKYYFNGLAIEVGPQISFAFGGKYILKYYTFEDVNLLDHYEEHHSFAGWEDTLRYQYKRADITNDFKLWNRINIGATAGLSYNMENGLFFGARYTFDFTNFLNDVVYDRYEYGGATFVDTEHPRYEKIKSHYGVVQLSVGYKF